MTSWIGETWAFWLTLQIVSTTFPFGASIISTYWVLKLDDEFVLKTASMSQEIRRDQKVSVTIDYDARGEDDDFGTLIFETTLQLT